MCCTVLALVALHKPVACGVLEIRCACKAQACQVVVQARLNDVGMVAQLSEHGALAVQQRLQRGQRVGVRRDALEREPGRHARVRRQHDLPAAPTAQLLVARDLHLHRR